MKYSLILISLALLGSSFGVNAGKASSGNSTRSGGFKSKLCAMGKTQFCPPAPIPTTTTTLIPTDIVPTPTLPPTPPIPTTTDTGLPTTLTTGTSPTTETSEPPTDTSPTTSSPEPEPAPKNRRNRKQRKARRNRQNRKQRKARRNRRVNRRG